MPQGDNRILLADDNASIRATYANGLSQLGYQCVTA